MACTQRCRAIRSLLGLLVAGPNPAVIECDARRCVLAPDLAWLCRLTRARFCRAQRDQIPAGPARPTPMVRTACALFMHHEEDPAVARCRDWREDRVQSRFGESSCAPTPRCPPWAAPHAAPESRSRSASSAARGAIPVPARFGGIVRHAREDGVACASCAFASAVDGRHRTLSRIQPFRWTRNEASASPPLLRQPSRPERLHARRLPAPARSGGATRSCRSRWISSPRRLNPAGRRKGGRLLPAVLRGPVREARNRAVPFRVCSKGKGCISSLSLYFLALHGQAFLSLQL